MRRQINELSIVPKKMRLIAAAQATFIERTQYRETAERGMRRLSEKIPDDEKITRT